MKKKHKHKFRYVDPLNVKKLIGPIAPSGYMRFAAALELALTSFDEGKNHCCVDSDLSPNGVLTIRAASVTPDPSGVLLVGSPGCITATRKTIPTLQTIDHNPARTENEAIALDKKLSQRLEVHADFSAEASTESFALMDTSKTANDTRRLQVALLVIHAHTLSGRPWHITLPLAFLLRGYTLQKNTFTGYEHRIEKPNGEFYAYAGITSRSWLTRMLEHLRGVRKGETKMFYNAWRAFAEETDIRFSSSIGAINRTYTQIMNWEERTVDHHHKHGRSLNAIPGGFKGLQYLHKLGRLRRVNGPDLKNREQAVREYCHENPNAGVPNLLMRELWKDEDYAAQVICNRPERLSVDQVREIRHLAAFDTPPEVIVDQVGARNLTQVSRVIEGDTYGRIH